VTLTIEPVPKLSAPFPDIHLNLTPPPNSKIFLCWILCSDPESRTTIPFNTKAPGLVSLRIVAWNSKSAINCYSLIVLFHGFLVPCLSQLVETTYTTIFFHDQRRMNPGDTWIQNRDITIPSSDAALLFSHFYPLEYIISRCHMVFKLFDVINDYYLNLTCLTFMILKFPC